MEQFFIGIGTIIGTAAILFYRDVRDGKHPFKKNGAYKSQQVLKKILDSQEQLQAHFNHDTTALLTEIRDGIKETSKVIEKHSIIEEAFQQQVRDFISESRRK